MPSVQSNKPILAKYTQHIHTCIFVCNLASGIWEWQSTKQNRESTEGYITLAKKKNKFWREILTYLLDVYAFSIAFLYKFKGVGEGGQGGGGGGGTCLPTFKSGGGTSGFVPPPPLLGRANVLSSLFAHILWLKHIFFSKFSWLASLANFNKSIFSKLC